MADDSLILRDQLAIDRTMLANERTLLSYARTSLAMLAGGVTLLKFFEGPAMQMTGFAAVGAGLAVGALGAVRFMQVLRRLRAARKSVAC